MITPAPLCPRMDGKIPLGSAPDQVNAPVAVILILTSPALGGSTSISSILKGSLAAHDTAHLIT